MLEAEYLQMYGSSSVEFSNPWSRIGIWDPELWNVGNGSE